MITLAMIAALAMPPKVYDHDPHIPFKVISTDSKQIYRFCPVPKGWTVFACVKGLKIYIRDDLDPAARKKVLRHEYGHLNGWVHGYPA